MQLISETYQLLTRQRFGRTMNFIEYLTMETKAICNPSLLNNTRQISAAPR